MRIADGPAVVLLRQADETDDRYERALCERGFRARSVPVLSFRYPNQTALRARLATPGRYAGLIVTSPRAVRAVAEAGEASPTWADWTHKPTYAVGPKTASALRALGCHPTGQQAGRGAALGAVIAKANNPYLFVCGNRRRDDLPNTLRQAGTPFEELVVYETVLRSDLNLPSPAEGDWLVFFSPSGTQAVNSYAPEQMQGYRLAAIGPTTADALRDLGLVPQAVASEPSPAALVAAVEQATHG